MKLTKSKLKQIIKEELDNHGLKHIKIEKLPDGRLQGIWNTTIDNLMAAEENDWIGQPDDVDQFEGSLVPDGVGPPRWRQPWEYEEEKNNVYWRESYRDEETTGGPTHLGFIKRMKEYDEAIEANIGTVAESKMKLSKTTLKQIIKEELSSLKETNKLDKVHVTLKTPEDKDMSTAAARVLKDVPKHGTVDKKDWDTIPADKPVKVTYADGRTRQLNKKYLKLNDLYREWLRRNQSTE